jgi:hypothetical protein
VLHSVKMVIIMISILKSVNHAMTGVCCVMGQLYKIAKNATILIMAILHITSI